MSQKTNTRKTAKVPAHLRRRSRQWFFVSSLVCCGFWLLFFTVFVNSFQTITLSQTILTPQNTRTAGQSEIPRPEMSVFTKKMHPWGGFEPGAWRLTKMSTEVYTADQKTENITYTENCVTLQKAEPEAFSLVVESLVNLAGKNVPMEPQTLRQGLHGLDPSEFQNFYVLKNEVLQVDSQPIPCQVIQFSFSDEKVRKTVTIWVNGSRAPYIFRKETSIRNLTENKAEEFTRTQVTSLNCQVAVFGKIYKGYQSKIESEFPSRKVHTVQVSSSEIPGGTVSRVAKETDLQGRLLQVTSAELMDFGVKEGDHQNELSRNTPIRAARYTVPRPVKASGTAPETPRTLVLTINFSRDNQEERKTPAIFHESSDFIRFRDRLWSRNDRDGANGAAKTNGRNENQNFLIGDSHTSYLTVEELQDIMSSGQEERFFAHHDSPTFAPVPTAEEKNPTQNKKRSPLDILRRNEPRKKRQEPLKTIAAMLDSVEASWSADTARGTLEISVFLPEEEKPRTENGVRASWRRHWRAAIIGEQH